MEQLVKTFQAIRDSNKEARQRNDFYKLLKNGSDLLDHSFDLIQILVDSEHEYRKVEAKLQNEKREDKWNTSAYCESHAKASEHYKNFRKATLINEWVLENVQLSKKLANDTNNNLKSQI